MPTRSCVQVVQSRHPDIFGVLSVMGRSPARIAARRLSGTARHVTTTERGLGWAHQQIRAALLRGHRDGTLCWWCGRPMYRSQDLAADHTLARARGGGHADRLLHARCNTERGDGSRDHLRPALRTAGRPAPRTSRQW